MTSQADLRHLMKLERKKRKPQLHHQEKGFAAKGILKAKSSYANRPPENSTKLNIKDGRQVDSSLSILISAYSDGSDSDKNESLEEAKKQEEDMAVVVTNNKKRRRGVGFNSNAEPEVAHNQRESSASKEIASETTKTNTYNSASDDPMVMKEFEDLLNCEEEDQLETTPPAAPKPQQKIEKKTKRKEKKDIDITTLTRNEKYKDDVEQAAYEARLAKLMLLRSQKRKQRSSSNEKGKDIENNVSEKKESLPIECMPALAFQDTSQIAMNNRNNEEVRNEKKKSSSFSVSDILKKKRAKKKQSVNTKLDDDDSFWK